MERKEEGSGPRQQVGQVCRVCSLDPECIPWDLEPADSRRLDGIVAQPPVLSNGEHLFRVGDAKEAVYAVRTGAFKYYGFDAEGREQVLGFGFAGELVGFDGVCSRRHGCNAVALKDSAVCVLPYADLTALMNSIASLRRQILRFAGRDFGNHTLDPGLGPAALVAGFLMDLAERNHVGDGFAAEFDLPMTLGDMANYLRLAANAVADVLDEFTAGNVIVLDGPVMRLLDPARLSRFAGRRRQ